MDVNTLRSVVTLLSFLAFAWIVWRAWRQGAQAGHAAAAVLPFEDETLPPDAGRAVGGER